MAIVLVLFLLFFIIVFAHKFAQIFTAADCDLVGAIKTGKL